MVHAQISPAICNAVNGVMQFALLNLVVEIEKEQNVQYIHLIVDCISL